MDARWGWPLVAAAFAVGFWQWGWPGVALAGTLAVFWMLLQFSRTLRVLGKANEGPIGVVPSAVMLHARLRAGMALLDILPMTRSLGRKLSDEPETYLWADDSGASVTVVFRKGRVESWRLGREEEVAKDEAESAAAAPPPGAAA